MVSTGKRIFEFRKKHRMSRERFARLVPCSSRAIVRWEEEDRGPALQILEEAVERVLSIGSASSSIDSAQQSGPDRSNESVNDQPTTSPSNGDSQAERGANRNGDSPAQER